MISPSCCKAVLKQEFRKVPYILLVIFLRIENHCNAEQSFEPQFYESFLCHVIFEIFYEGQVVIKGIDAFFGELACFTCNFAY